MINIIKRKAAEMFGLVAMLVLAVPGINAYAVTNNSGSNNISTTDKPASSSSIWAYNTFGFSATAIDLEAKDEDKDGIYNVIDYSDEFWMFTDTVFQYQTQKQANGHEVNTTTLPDDLADAVYSHFFGITPAEAYDSGIPMGLELNSVIGIGYKSANGRIYTGGYNPVYSGKTDSDQNQAGFWGELYTFGNGAMTLATSGHDRANGEVGPGLLPYLSKDTSPNLQGDTSQNWHDLKTVQNWSSKKSIDTHFKIQIFQNFDPALNREEEPDDPDDDGSGGRSDIASFRDTGTTGRGTPEVYTWHYSDKYHVGEGIPSSEVMTNEYLANWWYGTYDWGQTDVYTKQYTLKYEVPYKYWHESDDEDEDGEWRYGEAIVPVDTSRSAYYYALMDTNINELKEVRVQNEAYGQAGYNPSPSYSNLQIDVKVNNKVPVKDSTEAGSYRNPLSGLYPGAYRSTISQHITFPQSTGNRIIKVMWDEGSDDGRHEIDESERRAARRATYWMDVLPLQWEADNSDALTISAHNDRLVVNGITYMDDTPYYSHRKDVTPTVPAYRAIHYNDILDASDPGGDFRTRKGASKVRIPDTTKNGSYSTALFADYIRQVPFDGKEDDDAHNGVNAEGENAIHRDYKQNEPVMVHTPVVSPVRLTGGEAQTQLSVTPASKNTNASGGNPNVDTPYGDNSTVYELKLDGTYTMDFLPEQWYQNYEDEQRNLHGYDYTDHDLDMYDEYVFDKKVRFPFCVSIRSDGTETYYPLTDGGYTEWISVPHDTFTFYVPTWAKENTPYLNGVKDDPYVIEFRVEAINAEDDDPTTEAEQNSTQSNHVSTYELYANVSGVIYDFQIVGINDKDMFKKYNENASDSTLYSFALDKDEKKSGIYNRFGNREVRYTLDGIVTEWKTANTLPLRTGSSKTYSGMGTIWKGTTLAYSVKTIANLADQNDEVWITPTYRYVTKDGDVIPAEELKIFYSDSTGDYIEYGSSRDKNNVKNVHLGDPMFEGSWYHGGAKDWFMTNAQKAALPNSATYLANMPDNIQYTATRNATRHYGSNTTAKILNREVGSYTLSAIRLTPELRLLSGDPEELERNQTGLRTSGTPSYEEGTHTVPYYNNAIGHTGSKTYADCTDEEKLFRDSMQTWYGEYTVPNNLYVTYKSRLVAGPDGTSTNATLRDWAEKGKLTTDSNLWLKDGYLILNFQILTKNNGKDHLTYGSDSQNSKLNMWRTEGQPQNITVETQNTNRPMTADGNPKSNPVRKSVTIPTKAGDIAVIDLRYKLSDKYSPRIFMIN